MTRPECSEDAAGGRGSAAEGSTHWLRHTHGTHTIAAGVPADVVQNNLGHASIATTGIYVHSEKKRRHAEMARLVNQR